MKSLLETLEQHRAAHVATNGRNPRICIRTTSTSRRSGDYYLVSVGTDNVELSSKITGEHSFYLDRKTIVEAFFA